MATLVLSENGHIETPDDIRSKLSLKPGDALDAFVENGSIHLRPKLSQPGGQIGPAVDLSRWFGAGTGIFGSAEEIDDHIRNERDSWD